MDLNQLNREAMAEGFIELTPEAMQHLHSGVNAKGDVLTVAQLAGIQGAKKTSDIIPLCHQFINRGGGPL